MLRSMRDEAMATDDQMDPRVRRAAAGDREAFAELMEDELPRVWRVVWRILRHDQDTEDVVQDVFLQVHRALPRFRGEARFSTWLHRIAVNRALNHHDRAAERLRRASRPIDEAPDDAAGVKHGLALAAGAPTPLHALEVKELQQRLAVCLEKLPAAWRAVLALRDAEVMSYQEIAATLGSALGTVRSRLARTRLFLKRCVEGQPA
ncbi:MAG: RNA polymerase sigma factor [Acidobacteriota bacterium]